MTLLKIKRKVFTVILAVVICFSTVSFVSADKVKDNVKILFTHDLHSRMDSDVVSGEVAGGFARLKTLINQKFDKKEPTVLVDAGDFSMGTLYQTVYESQASELKMMGHLGFDATTFGNHEFDYRSEGVANMLNSAILHDDVNDGLVMPQFVISNIDWNKNNSKENKLVKDALETYGAKDYTVIERGGVSFGIYGVVGQDAEECAPASGIDFDSIVDTSKRVVDILKNEEKVDIIICLSHSGTDENSKKSEDEILAMEVPEIDLIVSGHTHTLLEKPIKHGDTYIVSAGEYGRHLGEIDLYKNASGRWSLESYKLNKVDSSIAENEDIAKKLEHYRGMINENYLKAFGYTYNQVLAVNNYDFTPINEFGSTLREDTLGSIIADSYMYAVKQAEGENYEQVALTVAPTGTIRDTLQKGEIKVWDVFNISCLGIGPDRITGYPLVSVYLTGAELKTVAEIDVSVSRLMTSAQLFPSGMKWEYNSNRLILNKVTDVKLVDENGNESELVEDKLYRVVAGLYSAQMLGAVEDTSKGILSVTPKDKNGNVIADFEEHIVYDKNGNEVKEWYALASYLKSFEKNDDGIAVIPERYSHPEGRKHDTNSKNIIEILKNPNKIALVIYFAIVVVLVLIIVTVLLVIRKIKRRKLKNA